MKKYILISVFVFINTHLICQCLNADSLYVTNITYINAQANWLPAPSADHYLIHYRELGIAISIGTVELFTKMVLYYFHERLWNKFV